MLTTFDQALEKLRASEKNPEISDQAHLEFYMQFFDTTFYLPVDEEPDLSAEDMELFPIVVEEEDGEAIYFFDTEERLKEWIGEEKIFSVALTGEDILMTFGPERALILNPTMDDAKEFYPDELEFLLETFFNDSDEEEDEDGE